MCVCIVYISVYVFVFIMAVHSVMIPCVDMCLHLNTGAGGGQRWRMPPGTGVTGSCELPGMSGGT